MAAGFLFVLAVLLMGSSSVSQTYTKKPLYLMELMKRKQPMKLELVKQMQLLKLME